jgi:hypothetical protein
MPRERTGIHTTELEVLKGIDFIKTDLSAIKEEIINFIKNDPEYSKTWNNYFDSDSGKILLDTFAFLMKKLLVRTDIQANEVYPSTAQQDSNILKVLRLIGYELRSFTDSQVYLDIRFVTVRPTTTVNLGINFSIPTTDTEGNNATFYVRNNATDYFNAVVIPLEMDGRAAEGLILSAFSGELRNEEIDRENLISVDSEVYALTYGPVNQDSIRVFYLDEYDVEQEALQVNSFFNVSSTEAQVPFIVRFDENHFASLLFGSKQIVKILPDGKNIKIYYTVNGGSKYNIVEQSIDYTDSFSTPNFQQATSVSINFTNPGKGFGGTEAETVDDAKLTAPLSLRTIERAVTEQDYELLLKKQGSVLHARALSPNDNRDYFPNAAKIPLFHVWLYITLNNQVSNMTDLLLSKQVNEKTGTLIGGDSYDILEYLKIRRISGIENVIKPTIYTRLYLSIKIRYNPVYDEVDIKNDSRDTLFDMLKLESTGYEKIVRSTAIKSRLKKINGVVDIYIESFQKQVFYQQLAPVSSSNFFEYVNDNPSIDNVETSDNFGQYYQAGYNEVIFVLDEDTDIVLNFESASQYEVL